MKQKQNKYFQQIVSLQNIKDAFNDIKEKFYNPKSQRYVLEQLARGIDGRCFANFQKHFHKEIKQIQKELKQFKQPLPSLDLKIPKNSNPNKFRTISISCLKEKIKHQAICRIIEPVLEQLYPNNLFSYRKGKGAYLAVKNLRKTIILNENNFYLYKVDMKDYFDNLDHEILINLINKIYNDQSLAKLLNLFLKQRRVEENSIIDSELGVVQGISISSHLANLYLMELDQKMADENINYFRVGDDIIVAHENEKRLKDIAKEVENFLIKERKLTINQEKTKIFNPDEFCEYMGYEINSENLRIAERNYNKMKNKIRIVFNKNISKHIDRNQVDKDEMLKEILSLIFPENRLPDHVMWLRYFMLSNDIQQIKKMDDYIENRIRLVFFGKSRVKNKFLLPSDFLKNYGYVSLSKIYHDITNGRKLFTDYVKHFKTNTDTN
ncbi:reverse transcriptase domain-containing protein [Patescibacteria group bacterium]